MEQTHLTGQAKSEFETMIKNHNVPMTKTSVAKEWVFEFLSFDV